jgi:hypothetical protein
MVSPVHGDYRRCQAEIPLIILCRFPGPALGVMKANELPEDAARRAVLLGYQFSGKTASS